MRAATPLEPSRWRFLRDVAVFQIKLVLDGLRDGLMIPVSLVAAAIDLLKRGSQEEGFFYRVAALGRRSEAYIDLFEVADRIELARHPAPSEDLRMDDLFRKVEDYLVEQESAGGLTSSARAQVDRLLDAIGSSREPGGR